MDSRPKLVTSRLQSDLLFHSSLLKLHALLLLNIPRTICKMNTQSKQLQHTSPQDYDPIQSKNFLWEQQAGVRAKTLIPVKTQRNPKGRSRHMPTWLRERSLESLDKQKSSQEILAGALLDGSSRGQVLTERTFPLCDWLHKTLLQRKPRKKGRFEQPSQFKQTTLCLTGKLRTSALVWGEAGGMSSAAHLRDAWGNQYVSAAQANTIAPCLL